MSKEFLIAMVMVLISVDMYAFANTVLEVPQQGVTQNSTIALVGIICNLIATCFVGWMANKGHDTAVESGKTAQVAVEKATEASIQSKASAIASTTLSDKLDNDLPHVYKAIDEIRTQIGPPLDGKTPTNPAGKDKLV